MLTVLDLFSGIGGISLGLEATGGFRTVAFCEIEAFPRLVLAKHWPGVPIFEDVRTLTAESLGGLRPDLICGGFPCQDISVAGKGKGLHGHRSGLWFEFARLVEELRPRWVLAENVGALRTRGVDRVCSDLEAEGYAVWPLLVGAWAVGAPHKRERVWIVAHRDCGRRKADWRGSLFDRERATSRHDADGRGERPVGDTGRTGLAQRQQPEDERGDLRHQGSSLASNGARECLADAERWQREMGREHQRVGWERKPSAPRWPARPGEPQHEWEEPRLAYGSERAVRSTGQPREGSDSRSPQLPVGRPASRLREQLVRRVVVTDGTTKEDGPREVLRLLSEPDDPQTVQRPLGRHVRISEATLLRLSLHGQGKGHGRTSVGHSSEPRTKGSSTQSVMRGLRLSAASPEASPQPGHDGQPLGERGDTLRLLPRERPLEEREAQILLDYLMNVRLARRANREALKALGNSVVPQVVYAIGRAILTVEEGLDG